MRMEKRLAFLDASRPALAPSPESRKLTYDALFFDCRDVTRTVRFCKNRDVIIAGDNPQFLFVNQHGWLFRYKILHDGRRQILNFVLPGEIFGLQAYVFKRSLYSVSTITAALLSAMPMAMVDRVAEQNAKLSKALFWLAMGEAAILGERLIDTARRSAYARVGHFLLELFVRLKRAGQTEHTSFHMPLTQELIGDALGLSAVHVNRTLHSLRSDKLIALDGKRVTLRQVDALCRLSDFEDGYLGEFVRSDSGCNARSSAPGLSPTEFETSSLDGLRT
jgi:CRP-like cAMP-binding protein